MNIAFDNTYVKLPDRFFSRQAPSPASAPALIRVNHALAEQLCIDYRWLESAEGINVLAGNSLPEGADPIATAYAGHQFGGWNPQLGDGRAILLGEVIDRNGQRFDLQLKGAGQTPYSRMGDGRAPLGPVLREYIVSESMSAMGIPTSRSLAAVSTGEPVYREETLPGAVLTRVAKSHIRIGTVQFFAARNDVEALRALVDHVIDRHYPEARDHLNPPVRMLELIMQSQARLIVQWQMVGFIHGVMNTDNMLLSGETIDYGPCAFMDQYDPEAVFSSIDHAGRYAYRNQPGIAHWNLACLAQALAPVLGKDEESAIELAKSTLKLFPDMFLAENSKGLRRKLGLTDVADAAADDEVLAKDFLDLLESNKSDFTLAFRRLSEIASDSSALVAEASIKSLYDFSDAFSPWLDRWRTRLAAETKNTDDISAQMLRVNLVLHTGRNQAAIEAGGCRAATYHVTSHL